MSERECLYIIAKFQRKTWAREFHLSIVWILVIIKANTVYSIQHLIKQNIGLHEEARPGYGNL